ncbi:MAG: leucine-rich repeat domain-containing protein [Alistipes sp.]|nr:leucine-rich repeat domain-containing protein [Alistipes sp.]
MKRILYIIYIMVATLAVTLIGGCEEQVFEYDFINNAGEEPAPTPTPTPGVNAKNVIYYTSTDGKVVTPNKDAFGVSIVSNTYTNGKGTITFSGTVTKIGEEAFYECSTLASITIPNSVTSIGNNAFHYCSGLTSVTIPNSVTSIGDYAFGNCTSLTSVTIPNSVTEIGHASFGGCTSLKSFYGKFASEDNRCLIVNGVLNSFAPAGLTSYIIPNRVTSIGNYAFYDCTSLTSVTIPNSVTSIGTYAFNYCTGLTSVTIPNSVTSIGSSAFHNCTSLTSVTIPNSVTSIGNYAFCSCSKLAEVYCKPTTPPTLGGSAVFDGNASDRKIYVPSASVNAYKTATNWSRYADQIVAEGSSTTEYVIEYTSSDGKVVTPYKTDVFGVNIVSNVYENGKGIITFDGPVTTIGEHAFYKCSTLASITIPNSVTSVGNYAFYGCTSLTSVTIPNSVTSIGEASFSSCTSLKSIYGKFASEDNRCLIVNGALQAFAPAGLTSYIIPNGVTSIGDYAFGICTSLTSVTIPESVTSIGTYAFGICSGLTSVTIPNSVTSIGNYAFYSCSKLATVYCKPTTPPTLGGSSVFDTNASDRKIYVPSASVSSYKTATYWSEYASQIVADPS